MDATERTYGASAEAAHWVVRLQSGETQREEREQFVDWLRESQLHVAEMLRVLQIQGILERFDSWTQIAAEGSKPEDDTVIDLAVSQSWQTRAGSVELPDNQGRSKHNAWRRTTRLQCWALAACLAVAAVGVSYILPLLRGQVIETVRGERREVVLSDGSVIQVDPQTRLRVRYADQARRVILERGRAVFHVAKNPNRQFVVLVSDTTVRAVGTVFGVEERAQAVIVTVIEGRVAVGESVPTSKDIKMKTAAPRRADPQPVLVGANEQVTVTSGAARASAHEVDSQSELAWAEGRLVFHNDPVSTAVAEFNRYNIVRLKVTDTALANRHVSGVFNASEPEAFIAFLQTVMPLEIARDGDGSILIGPPPIR